MNTHPNAQHTQPPYTTCSFFAKNETTFKYVPLLLHFPYARLSSGMHLIHKSLFIQFISWAVFIVFCSLHMHPCVCKMLFLIVEIINNLMMFIQIDMGRRAHTGFTIHREWLPQWYILLSSTYLSVCVTPGTKFSKKKTTNINSSNSRRKKNRTMNKRKINIPCVGGLIFWSVNAFHRVYI